MDRQLKQTALPCRLSGMIRRFLLAALLCVVGTVAHAAGWPTDCPQNLNSCPRVQIAVTAITGSSGALLQGQISASINNTSGTSFPLTLPPSPIPIQLGGTYVIWDAGGNAGTNPIVLTPPAVPSGSPWATPLVNGAATYSITANGGIATCYYDAVESPPAWFCSGGQGGGGYTLPTATSTVLGGVKPDNSTILNAAGVLTATPASIGALATSALGTGVAAALGVNVGTAGAPVVLGGAAGTPSSLVLTNATGLPNASVGASPLPTPGAGATLAAPRSYYVCTTTCTVTIPVPAAGYEFCVENDDNVSTVITLAALGSSAMYENAARTAYGTAGTGTFVSGGAVGDKACILGRDATHYLTQTTAGTWVAN